MESVRRGVLDREEPFRESASARPGGSQHSIGPEAIRRDQVPGGHAEQARPSARGERSDERGTVRYGERIQNVASCVAAHYSLS